VSATDRRFGFFYSPKVLGQSSRGLNLMFVVIQFPVADGRAFASGSGVVDRPDWGAPKISPLLAHRDFVRGFGRLAYRRKETSAAWVDEDFFAYAKRAVQFPTLQQRHFEGQGSGRWMVKRSSRWMVSCRFRRLFCDGEATVRLEIGFAVTPDYERGKVSPDEVVRQLLGLPAVVPAGWSGNTTKDLVLLGPYIARRYAQASTRHGWNVAATLVTAGDPIVVVESSGRERTPPGEAIGVSIAPQRPGHLYLATTRTPHGGIETWYLHHETYDWRDVLAFLRQYVQGETLDAYRDACRDVRLAILRQHAQEETLDRILRWVATGALSYSPQSADGDRLENYINSATKIVNRATYRGVDCGALRDALDAATSTQRQAIEIRRRERLDGMRRQVREKAERFLAEREARRPTFNVSGRVVHVGDQIFSGQFYGPVAGTVYAEKMQNSFNSFASRQPDEGLRSRVAELHEQVADLVGRLKEVSPDEANEVADTLASFTDEVGKDTPNKVTLRALGNGLVDVAKKVAELATPIATAVSAVLKVFGIAAL
jgi:hypothetical protein